MDPSAAAAVTQTMKLTASTIQLHVHAALYHESGMQGAAGLCINSFHNQRNYRITGISYVV
jgi:hypothetical protein